MLFEERGGHIWKSRNVTGLTRDSVVKSLPAVQVMQEMWPSKSWCGCNPMDCSLPGSSVHGILQARILEWAAMPSSRGSSRPRD